MLLSREVVARVESLRERDPARGSIVVSRGTHSFRVDVEDVDRLAVVLSKISFTCGRRLAAPELPLVSTVIGSRLGYLLEPIELVEYDEARGSISMRSRPPHVEGGFRRWYDVRIDSSGEIEFSRRCWTDATRVRSPEPFTLTREVFLRLLGDLESLITSGDTGRQLESPPC